MTETAPGLVRKQKSIVHLISKFAYINPNKNSPADETNVTKKLDSTFNSVVQAGSTVIFNPAISYHMIQIKLLLLFPTVPQVLALMTDLDDDEEALAEWSIADEAEDDAGDTNPVAGENAIDRIACALGGKTILPHIMTSVPPMLQHGQLSL